MIQSSTVLNFRGRSWDDVMHTCKTILGMAQRHPETVLGSSWEGFTVQDQPSTVLRPSRDRVGSSQDHLEHLSSILEHNANG